MRVMLPIELVLVSIYFVAACSFPERVETRAPALQELVFVIEGPVGNGDFHILALMM